MLDSKLLLACYRQGIFPMAVDDIGSIKWFSPNPRALIPLDDRFHISHGLRRTLKKRPFEIRFDTQFETVMLGCASNHGSTWISEEILQSYCELHRQGHAHSVETWKNGELVGGLYGVHIGGAFFGESMFHHQTDASKVALVALVERLRSRNFNLLDTQWQTEHLLQFGTYLVSRTEYLELLSQAVAKECVF